MTTLSAAQKSQMYTELAASTSPETAEVIMENIADVHWDDLVTKDHLDSRLAHVDATIARTGQRQTVWIVSAMFAFNGLLATWLTAVH